MSLSMIAGSGQSSITYTALDGNGNPATGITFETSSTACGTVASSSVNPNTGEYTVLVDPPAVAPPPGTVCNLVATAPDGIECTCPITITAPEGLDCNQSTWNAPVN